MIKKFFAPHSGQPRDGAAVAPPPKLLAAANVLNGLSVEMETATDLLWGVARELKLGNVEVRGNAILVFSGRPDGNETNHIWAVIRFE